MKKLTYEQSLVVRSGVLYGTRGVLEGIAITAVTYATTFGCKCCGMSDNWAKIIGGAVGSAMSLGMFWVDEHIEKLNDECVQKYYVEIMKILDKHK